MCDRAASVLHPQTESALRLQVCIAASLASPVLRRSLLEALVPRAFKRAASATGKAIDELESEVALRPDEFVALFGSQTGGSCSLEAATRVAGISDRVASCMATSLEEAAATEAWAAPSTRLATVLALHLPDSQQRIEDVTGVLLRSDARRVSGLVDLLEDVGDENMALLESTISELAKSAVCR